MANLNLTYPNIKGDIDGGAYDQSNNGQQTVLLLPVGETVKVKRNTITTTFRNKVYRRRGTSDIFEEA